MRMEEFEEIFTFQSREKKFSTKLEAFLFKKGMVIVKDIFQLGLVHIGNCHIDLNAVEAYELGKEDEKISGMVIEITIFGSDGDIEVFVRSFLDFEELENLSKALVAIKEKSEKWKSVKKDYSEVTFSSKDYFKVGFCQQTAITNDQTFFITSGLKKKAVCFLPSAEDLMLLKLDIDRALNWLKRERKEDKTKEEVKI